MLFMMDRESALQCFLKDVHYVVCGAKTRKVKIQSLNWSSGKAGALAVVNVPRVVLEEPYR
jgi:hypothetical protein